MSKTTIDGLKVRSPKQRSVKPTAKPGNTFDITTPRNSKPRATADTDILRMLPEVAEDNNELLMLTDGSSDSGFLDPVKSFPYGDTEAALAETNEDDWSNLLSEMDGEGKADDFHELDGWSDGLNEELSEEPLPDREKIPKKQAKVKKKWSVKKTVALAVVGLLVLGGGALYLWGDSLISKLTGGNSGLWSTLSAMVSDAVPFDTDENGRTNVLIFGTEGYNMDGATASGVHDGAQLTDSIMVASFNQDTKDVALISLPRDLKVPMACMAGKINEVFSCYNQDGTNEQAGAEALMEQIGDVLGMDFQYYAHVNWASLIEIIDTIGGITVTLDEDINDYGFTGAVAQAGVPIEVNGEQALGLARARHGTQGGDFTRGNTQQKIVAGVLEKVVKNGLGPAEALGLLNILGDNLRTNFSAENIKSGVKLASGFDIGQIRQIALADYNANTFYVTTSMINDISYVVPAAGVNDYSQIQDYVDRMLSNDPMQREGATVVVYNATGSYGVAGTERDKLTADGFNVIAVADAPAGVCTEQYCVYANSDKSATRAALAERYGEVQDGVPAGLQSDADFVVVVGIVEQVSAL